MDTGLTLHIKPSKQLMLFYLLLAIVSLLGILALPFAVWVKFALALLVLMLIVYVLLQHVFLYFKSSIVSLIYLPNAAQTQRWKIVTKAGESYVVALRLQDCFVSPYLTVLNMKPAPNQTWFSRVANRQSLIILPDRVSKDAYRRLRILLNWTNHRDEESLV